MPSKERVLDAYREEYLARLTKEKRAEKTVQEYRRLILEATDAWKAAGLHCSPKKIGEEEIDLLRYELWCDLEPKPGRRQLSIIGTYLKWHGNPVVERMKIPWPYDSRPHADWLDPSVAVTLMDNAEGIGRMIIHLELFMGLRRIELIRLHLTDLHQGYADILGKGKLGGKPRAVPYFQDTIGEITAYLEQRNEVIKRARARNPDVAIPDSLFIYEKGGKLYAYQKSALDSFVRAISEATGIKFSNHTLRRTYGRMLFYAGVRIEVIMKIFGHESVEQTIKYLGLQMDDMAAAQRKLGEYADALKKGNSCVARVNGGPKEIWTPQLDWPDEFMPYIRAVSR